MVLEPLTGRNTTGRGGRFGETRGSGTPRSTQSGRAEPAGPAGGNAPDATAYRGLANASRGTSARPSGFHP